MLLRASLVSYAAGLTPGPDLDDYASTNYVLAQMIVKRVTHDIWCDATKTPTSAAPFRHLAAAGVPGKAPALPPGAFEIGYTSHDGAQHRVPLAETAVVRFADTQPTRRLAARQPGR